MARSAHGLDTPRGTHWETRAACRPGQPVDPEWWWPIATSLAEDAARALHICRTHCPVMDQCRQAIQDQPPRHPTVQGGVRYVVDPRNHHRAVPAPDAPHPPRVTGCPYCEPPTGGVSGRRA